MSAAQSPSGTNLTCSRTAAGRPVPTNLTPPSRTPVAHSNGRKPAVARDYVVEPRPPHMNSGVLSGYSSRR